MKFECGDRVAYISGRHGDRDTNPLWDGMQGFIGGTLIKVSNDTGMKYRVKWDNGSVNSYYAEDLDLLDNLESQDDFGIFDSGQLKRMGIYID